MPGPLGTSGHLEWSYFPPALTCVTEGGDHTLLTSPLTTVLLTLVPLALAATALTVVIRLLRRPRIPAPTPALSE